MCNNFFVRLDCIELNLSLPLSFGGWNQQMSLVVALSFSTFISSSSLFLSFILSSFSKIGEALRGEAPLWGDLTPCPTARSVSDHLVDPNSITSYFYL